MTRLKLKYVIHLFDNRNRTGNLRLSGDFGFWTLILFFHFDKMKDFNWNKSLCEVEFYVKDKILIGYNCIHSFYDNNAGHNKFYSG